MLNAYIPIFIFLLVAIGFALFTLMMSQLVQSKKYNKVKLEPYECGIEPTTDARDRYSVRYYLVAMLFVIFDVETVFMFPWAVIFDKLMLFGLIVVRVAHLPFDINAAWPPLVVALAHVPMAIFAFKASSSYPPLDSKRPWIVGFVTALVFLAIPWVAPTLLDAIN